MQQQLTFSSLLQLVSGVERSRLQPAKFVLQEPAPSEASAVEQELRWMAYGTHVAPVFDEAAGAP